MMKTKLCHLLGIEHPIIAAPMGPDLTGPEFVAAVSNAGGLGILQAQLAPPNQFRAEIRRVRDAYWSPEARTIFVADAHGDFVTGHQLAFYKGSILIARCP